MEVWSIGVEQALFTIAQGVETSNGSMIQIGIDRLSTRAEMDSDLAESFPNAIGEAIQDGLARAFRKKCKAAAANSQFPYLPSICNDTSWILGVVADQDEWGKIVVEESVRLMAISAARCAPMVALLKTMSLEDCMPAASSFFGALFCYDRMARLGSVSPEVAEAIGIMLTAWQVDSAHEGLWSKCPELVSFYTNNQSASQGWPESSGLSPMIMKLALEVKTPQTATPKVLQEIKSPAQGRARPSARR